MTSRARMLVLAALAAVLLAPLACRPQPRRPAEDTRQHPPVTAPDRVARGAVVYVGYCARCHGAAMDGRGALAETLHLRPTDLRAPGLRAASDEALVERLMRGTPLVVPAGDGTARDLDAAVVGRYVAILGNTDWDVLRAGRVAFEESCAPCHGPYGRAEGAVGRWLGVPDLLVVRERVSDVTLARVGRYGVGAMPALDAGFDAVEMRALVTYVRHLSDGFRAYDTYCADCHGDDGAGIYSDELVPPATAAPPLAGPYPRAKILHMLRRERGLMPHFRDVLDAERLRDAIVYVRTVTGAQRPR